MYININLCLSKPHKKAAKKWNLVKIFKGICFIAIFTYSTQYMHTEVIVNMTILMPWKIYCIYVCMDPIHSLPSRIRNNDKKKNQLLKSVQDLHK